MSSINPIHLNPNIKAMRATTATKTEKSDYRSLVEELVWFSGVSPTAAYFAS